LLGAIEQLGDHPAEVFLVAHLNAAAAEQHLHAVAKNFPCGGPKSTALPCAAGSRMFLGPPTGW